MSYMFHYTILEAGKGRSTGIATLPEAMSISNALLQLQQQDYFGGATVISFEPVSCSGCRNNDANQDAHTDYGGCMYEEDELQDYNDDEEEYYDNDDYVDE